VIFEPRGSAAFGISRSIAGDQPCLTYHLYVTSHVHDFVQHAPDANLFIRERIEDNVVLEQL